MAWILIGVVALVVGGAWWVLSRNEQRKHAAKLRELQERIAQQEREDQKRRDEGRDVGDG